VIGLPLEIAIDGFSRINDSEASGIISWKRSWRPIEFY